MGVGTLTKPFHILLLGERSFKSGVRKPVEICLTILVERLSPPRLRISVQDICMAQFPSSVGVVQPCGATVHCGAHHPTLYCGPVPVCHASVPVYLCQCACAIVPVPCQHTNLRQFLSSCLSHHTPPSLAS